MSERAAPGDVEGPAGLNAENIDVKHGAQQQADVSSRGVDFLTPASSAVQGSRNNQEMPGTADLRAATGRLFDLILSIAQ